MWKSQRYLLDKIQTYFEQKSGLRLLIAALRAAIRSGSRQSRFGFCPKGTAIFKIGGVSWAKFEQCLSEIRRISPIEPAQRLAA